MNCAFDRYGKLYLGNEKLIPKTGVLFFFSFSSSLRGLYQTVLL
jgi:hypothetical protein